MRDLFYEQFVKDFNALLAGDVNYINLALITPENLEKRLSELAGERINLLEDLDTNGWQHDFWSTFDYLGTKLQFSGSWYDGHYQLSRIEE